MEGSGAGNTGQAQTLLEVAPVTLPADSIPYGYCHCGCGQKAPLAKQTSAFEGIKRGQPQRYLRHHHKRRYAIKSTSPTYISWHSMIVRTRPGYPRSKWYGDKGIVVCNRWQDFNAFLEDMGERPPGTSIDRIDGNKGYDPSNCRWATKKEQSTNRCSNVSTTIDGKTMTLSEWADVSGLKRGTVWRRYKVGYRGSALIQPLLKFKGCASVQHDIAGSPTEAVVRACERCLLDAELDELHPVPDEVTA